VGMPYEASAWVVQELVARAEVTVYEKTAHGMCVTYPQMVVVEAVEISALHRPYNTGPGVPGPVW
jgi:hypothetical protein